MKTWSFDSPDPETTAAFARELGRAIGADGAFLGLIGPLGAGKTVFVKGLAEGLGVDPRLVSSPTFVIAQQYPIGQPTGEVGPEWLHHVDLYRLESEAELESIGFFDLFDPGCVVAAEWADRFPDALGPERLEIVLEGPGPEGDSPPRRRVAVRAWGPLAESILEDWSERANRAARLGAGGAEAEGAGAGPARALRSLLVIALLLFGIAHLEWAPEPLPCTHPTTTESDAWGSLRVRCEPVEAYASFTAAASADASLSGRPAGIGGLLFGRPLALATVTAVQLEALPGIGPSRARAIVASRDEAPFESLEELERVSGIGPRIRAELSQWLFVEGEAVFEAAAIGDGRG